MSEGVTVGAPSAAGTDGGSAASADQSTTTETTDGSEYDPSNPPPIDPGFGDDIDDTGEAEPGETLTLKVNGKEIQMPLAEVISAAQRELAAGGKLEQVKKQAAELQTQQALVDKQKGAVKQLIQVLSTGDIDTIAEFMEDRMNAGDAFKKGIIQYCMKLYEHSKMSPEQREAVESKRELTKMRAQHEERTKQDAQRAFDYQVNQWTQHINVEVPKAIAEAGLPDTAFVREHMIQTWKAAVERGQQPTARAVADHVKARMADAKMLTAPQATPAKMARPRATPASVGMKNGKAESQYISMEDLQRSRGR